VRQRADCFNTIGRPKSAAGERTVPLIPLVVTALRAHRLSCPKGKLDLVFPTRKGTIDPHTNIIRRDLHPVMIKAGIVDESGKAKYSGMHSLRHFYCSWCINRRVDGGLVRRTANPPR
jgi:integrase